ncbi:MAG: protein-tyrosine-phosphatase [Myxococcota bacterium]
MGIRHVVFLPLTLAAPALAGCATATSEDPAANANAAAPTSGSDAVEEAGPARPEAPGVARLHPPLATYVRAQVLPGVTALAEERRYELDKIARYLRQELTDDAPARLTFICTHNSRRSHLSQLWASAAAVWFGVEGLETYSGGTEATAFNPRAVAALERAGFAIDRPAQSTDNPRYAVRMGPELPPAIAFSKVYDEAPNPSEDFAAIMTCSAADASCPFIPGAELRVGIPYEDPKAADGTPEEAATYDARSRQIATEMFYVLSHVSGAS